MPNPIAEVDNDACPFFRAARRLLRVVRPTDAVARIGGDEFAILLEGITDTAQAELVALKVVKALREPFELQPCLTVQIGASVGGAVGKAVRGDWPALLERADRMLYQARTDGRDRYVVAAAIQRLA